jgi:2-dehydropantoate 2-reductase
MPKLRILFFGAGAIGTYIGASLAGRGQRVAFIEQPKVIDELRQRGLRLDRGKYGGEAVVIAPDQIDLYASLAEALQAGRYDAAVFALKSFDTETALEGIRPFTAQMPPILCLQNGVENEQKIAALLGADKVIYGSVTSSVGRRGTGDMLLEKQRGIGIGASSEPGLRALIDQLLIAMADARLNPQLVARPLDMKWSKMLGNQLTSATSAILDMTPDEVLSSNALFELEMEQLRETLAVMKAQGLRAVDLPGAPMATLALAPRLPRMLIQPVLRRLGGDSRGAKMPSFHIDLHSGREQSEIVFLHGAVVRIGEKIGVPTPVNKLLTDTLLSLVRREIPLETYARQPEKFVAMLK